MTLTPEAQILYAETAAKLKGADRRRFQAQVIRSMGSGGQSVAARELGWCRDTIRKGLRELENGIPVVDNFAARGRKAAEELLPNLVPVHVLGIASGQALTVR